jgi:subtilisin family serine protease
MAYGEIIRSAWNTGVNSYEENAGTSMASPQIAGGIALLWSAKPELIGQIDKTFEIIRKSATPIKSQENCGGFSGSQTPNATFGYGFADIYKAIQTAR